VPSSSMDVTREALGTVLDLDPTQLRADTPLTDIGADSIAVILVADVIERRSGVPGQASFIVDNDRLRRAGTVGDLATAVVMVRR
jgi:acyl carrier protein